MVDLGIVQFNKVASVNNASDCTTKIVPGFTWTSLSRFMIGASPKFIPGTQIDVRYAQQLAREQRERERAAEEPVDQVSTANAALQAFPTQKASLATLNSEGVTHMHSPKDSSLTLSGNSHQGQSCSADVKAQFAVGHSAIEVKA